MKAKAQVQVRTASVTFGDWIQQIELLVKFRLSTFVRILLPGRIRYCGR